jgi:DNA topoisomerase II
LISQKQTNERSISTEIQLQIKEFIKTHWTEYADYDNRRSLPNIMDGLKITQRKAMYTALSLPDNTKPVKVSQFAAKAAELTAYHHGENSMVTTVVGLAQNFPGSNNYPLLEKHGQFGTRLSTEAAGERYIHTKLHKNWDRFFKAEDQEIVEYLYDDGDKIEPKYYIPIIPMILINGADGVGNGFKSKILNYDVGDVVYALKELIKYDKVKTPLIPKLNNWHGTIEKVDKQVTFTGKLKIINTTKLHITELPLGYDNEKYKKLLNALIEKRVIKDYQNNSTEDKWDWVIDCPRDTSALGHDKLLELLGLVSKVSENFVCWGVDDSAPITFSSPEELIAYWYAERLKLYDASIKDQIKKRKEKIIILNLKIKFIEWCLKNDFRKLSKADFISHSVSAIKNLSTATAGEFVTMPMYRITTDEVEKINNEMNASLDALDVLESLTTVAVMEQNLKGLI